MKKIVFSFLCFLLAFYSTNAQVPILGTYPASTILNAGGNGVIVPSIVPANTTSIYASSTTNFKGQLQINPVDGHLIITNAHPAGSYLVNIKAYNGATSTSTSVLLTIGNTKCSNGQFTPSTDSILLTNPPSKVYLADFNNDGKQDLLLVYGSVSTATVKLGNGLGGFVATTDIPLVASAYSATIGDFNGDGKMDFATSNANGTGTISIRLGDGNGNFVVANNLNLGTTSPVIALADFNGDGIPDLAIPRLGYDTVYIRLGDGLGGFIGSNKVYVGGRAQGIVTGDFNNDGKKDIATANSNNGTVAIRLGDGLGSFTGTTQLSIGINSLLWEITTGDFNSDGNQDLVVVDNSGNGDVHIRLGDGLGGFTAANSVHLNTGSLLSPNSVAVGDFNGDGKEDLLISAAAVYSSGTSTAAIRLGDGNGNFSGTYALNFSGSPQSLAVGDFNSDGHQDFLLGNYSSKVSIRISGANNMEIQGNSTLITPGSPSPSIADYTDFGNGGVVTRTFTIQNTGNLNLLVNTISFTGIDTALFRFGGIILPKTVAPGAATTFTVTFSPKSGGLKTARIIIGSDNCNKALYDFAVQGTGLLPTIGTYNAPSGMVTGSNLTVVPSAIPSNFSFVSASTSGTFKGILMVNPTNGNLVITNAYPAGTYNIKVKALNGLLADSSNFQLIVIKPNCSQALFANITIAPTGAGSNGVVVGDFNRDGLQDLATANGAANNVSIRLGNGSGTFSGTTQLAAGTQPQSIAVADFNGDGKQDLVIANALSANASVRYGDGLGGFTGSTEVAVSALPYCVATGDFNGDGRSDFATANYAAGSVSVVLANASGGFDAALNVVVGGSTYSLALSDFNMDGKLDIITANLNGSISVRLGNEFGAFVARTEITAGTNPYAVAVGDFNKDGAQDFVTANYNSSGFVTVGFGDSTGSFNNLLTLPVGTYPRSVAIGDFNGDGLDDFSVLVTDVNAISNNKLIFYLSNGDRSFRWAWEVNVGSAKSAIGLGDFNADGTLDFAAADNYNGSVNISLGRPNLAEFDIKFSNVSIADEDYTPSFSDSTDFGPNGIDGSYTRTFSMQNLGTGRLFVQKMTITGADASSFLIGGTYFPYPVQGGAKGTFTISFKPTTPGVKTAIIHIYNDDCDESVYDFAVQGNAVLPTLGNYTSINVMPGGNVSVLPSATPTYTSGAVTAYSTTNFRGVITVNPVTGIVSITNAQPSGVYTITVRSASVKSSFILTVTDAACTNGVLTKTENISVGTGGRFLAVGDFNNDGIQDFVAGGSAISVRLGDGAGSFYTNTIVNLYADVYFIAVGDFNGDGKQDLAIPMYGYPYGVVSILLGDGTGNFSKKQDITAGTFPYSVSIGDFNGDGKQDLAISNSYASSVSVKLGTGTGEFTGSTVVATGTEPRSVVTGDFNGDGFQDFATANYSANNISVKKGNGTGIFTAESNVTVGTNPQALLAADMNGDGKTDLLTANYTSNTVSICLGNGSAGFAAAINIAVGAKPISIIVGDFNNDGKQDFATTGETNSAVSIRFGDGLGGFTSGTDLIAESKPVSLGVGDFNADGRQDLVVLNATSSNVSVLLGLGSEIEVKGNDLNITDGDATPNTLDNTDFGTMFFTDSITRNFSFKNIGNDSLIINSVNISGKDSASFSKGTMSFPYRLAPGDSALLLIKFIPGTSGKKLAKINILNSDCNESLFDFDVQGFATPSGMALDFDGVDDFIGVNTTAGNIDTGNVTISAWVRTTSTVASSILSKRNNCTTGNFFDFGISSTGTLSLEFAAGASIQSLVGTKIVNDGIWHQVAAVRKDTILYLYVDGVLDTTFTFAAVAIINNAATLSVGASGCNGGSHFFKGQIDDLRFWGKALSLSSIQNSLNCELESAQGGLIAYYKFNQGMALGANPSITSLLDESSNNNGGTLYNFALNGTVSNWISANAVSAGNTCTNINVWRGVSSDWGLASNWSLGIVPFEESVVIIEPGVSFMPEINGGNAICYSIRLNNGATVTVKGTAKLNVVGK